MLRLLKKAGTIKYVVNIAPTAHDRPPPPFARPKQKDDTLAQCCFDVGPTLIQAFRLPYT